MIETLTLGDRPTRDALFDQMHSDRKRVFVDWLKWEVPHSGGQEVDRFDDEHATYLVVRDDADGRHLGSVRLLETERPHILSELFPGLCQGGVPRGPLLREITRMCVSPDCPPDSRLHVRRTLVGALARHALAAGLIGYTAVTDVGFMARVASVGWRCRALGLPEQTLGGESLAALLIEIDDDTVDAIREAGAYVEGAWGRLGVLERVSA
jgi:acyl-homoserine lactone synthase